MNDKLLTLEIDTGAAVSLISEQTFGNLYPKLSLQPSHAILETYSGERIPVLGDGKVLVQYKGQQKLINLVVIAGSGSCLLGRNWMAEFQQDWTQVATVLAHKQ